MPNALKPISWEAIPAAIEKVHRYRNLNEPVDAESICLDILRADPANQTALALLLLARTDQIEHSMHAATDARELLSRFATDYDKAYYEGIIWERSAKALIKHQRQGSSHAAYEQLQQAMQHFERAEQLRPHDNDEALLRFNACVRLLERHSDLQPRPAEFFEAVTSE